MAHHLHKSEERGKGEFSWLSSKHSFSFGDYYDAQNMGFGALRVINDDTIAPGTGFPDHPHRDMEIFTIPLAGQLLHKDNMGNHTVIKKGEIQIMSAGHGVVHSELNNSKTQTLELLQIWIEPSAFGIAPRHEEKSFSFLTEKNKLHEIINPTGSSDALRIYQNAYVSLGTWDTNESITYAHHSFKNGLYVFLIEGKITIDGVTLERRDAMSIVGPESTSIEVEKGSFILIIEVPIK